MPSILLPQLRFQRLPRRVRMRTFLVRGFSSRQADDLVQQYLGNRSGSGDDDTDTVVRVVRRGP